MGRKGEREMGRRGEGGMGEKKEREKTIGEYFFCKFGVIAAKK